MKKIVAAILFSLLASPAFANQIDCVAKWTDKATAMADAQAVLQTSLDGQGVRQWLASNVMEIQPWRDSQDTLDSDGNVVHHPLSGYFVLISLDHVMPALRDEPAIQVCIDRDKMNAGQGGFVLKSNVSNAILQDIRFGVFAGMNVPWGGLN